MVPSVPYVGTNHYIPVQQWIDIKTLGQTNKGNLPIAIENANTN